MFQKLKDKFAEEVKQSALKFPVSVQQLTQAVSSSSSSPSKVNSESNEEKEKTEVHDLAADEICLNSEYDSSFTTIDLRSPTPVRNRRSSSSSDLFPIYEFPPSRHNLLSDLESNSEFDDGSSIHQFTNVSKEILYEKYRNMLQKYHKYRGRFTDVRKYCQEMEREHDKMKNILTETQDKAIRRTKELKEQCILEQTAKAHLEGVLRNELEERDLIISTLNTKIKLLKSGKNLTDDQPKTIFDSLENVNENDPTVALSFHEIQFLKDKIKNFELLLIKAKEAITNKNMKIRTLEAKIESEKNEHSTLNTQLADLQHKIDLMKLKEEEALLSLAENKMVVHKELEAKEKHIKILEDKVSQFENEMKRSKIKEGETDAFSNTENLRLKNELLQFHTSPEFGQTNCSFNNVSKKTPNKKNDADLSCSRTNSDSEEVKELSTKVEQYRKQVEKQESLIQEKQKELDLLRATKENEIIYLAEMKASQDIDVFNLKTEISQLKTESLKNTKNSEEIIFLNNSLDKMRSALNEKDEEVKVKLDIINKLESELSVITNKLLDSSKYQKMWEELVTTSKADKIVSEELMKNIKTELSSAQADLGIAKSKIEKYELDLKNKAMLENEKCNLEKQLVECNNKLKQLTCTLAQTKENENEMHMQIANYLEEINKLKSKEDEYLKDLRKSKEDVLSLQNVHEDMNALKSDLKNSQVRFEELSAKNEILENENIGLKENIKELKNNVNELETSLIENKIYIQEYDSLKLDKKKLTLTLEDLKNSAMENIELKLENEKLVKQNEEILNKIEKLIAENGSLQKDIDLLKQIELERLGQVENLKNLCELNEQFSTDYDILQAVFEKFQQLVRESDCVKKENERLKCEAGEFLLTSVELENCRKNNELFCSQIKNLEETLSSHKINFDKLFSQYSQLQREMELNLKSKLENEEMIRELQKELAAFTESPMVLKDKNNLDANDNDSRFDGMELVLEQNGSSRRNITDETLSNDIIIFNDKRGNNEMDSHGDDCSSFEEIVCSKTSFDDLKIERNADTLSMSNWDTILQIRSQLIDLKAKNAEMKKNMVYFSKFLSEPSTEEEICFQQLVKMIYDCEHEKETIHREFLLLKKEKEDILTELQNCVFELDEVKRQSEESIRRQELLFKEKYSKEMMTIITGYEARLLEKDNENGALYDKLNLRADREKTAMYHESKEVIQNLQEELTVKQDSYAELLLKYENEVQELNNKLTELKEYHAKELRENDKKWRSCLDKKIEEVEEKYKDEINELTKEWTIDRKLSNAPLDTKGNDSKKFLENSAKQSEDSEALKKQVQILTNELNDCKKTHWREIDLDLMNASYNHSIHPDLTLEDCTEMEYLRNILFKYMMGHQPLILAKVLAAVVKFDNNQTEQILQREEQKQSLMGHLGFT